MATAFNFYNRKYFGGALPTPRFSVGSSNGTFGEYELIARYDWRRRIINRRDNGTISLTNAYSRSQHDVCNTLLHEMVHEYVNLVIGIWPRDPHGMEFLQKAREISADGWNICAENALQDTDVVNGGEEGEDNFTEGMQSTVLCIIFKPNGRDYKFWATKGSQNESGAIIQRVTRLQSPDIEKVAFYECYSEGLSKANVDVSTLSGVGGMSIGELANKLSSLYGGSPSNYNIMELKELKEFMI